MPAAETCTAKVPRLGPDTPRSAGALALHSGSVLWMPPPVWLVGPLCAGPVAAGTRTTTWMKGPLRGHCLGVEPVMGSSLPWLPGLVSRWRHVFVVVAPEASAAPPGPPAIVPESQWASVKFDSVSAG